jgi:hypothetical protein
MKLHFETRPYQTVVCLDNGLLGEARRLFFLLMSHEGLPADLASQLRQVADFIEKNADHLQAGASVPP